MPNPETGNIHVLHLLRVSLYVTRLATILIRLRKQFSIWRESKSEEECRGMHWSFKISKIKVESNNTEWLLLSVNTSLRVKWSIKKKTKPINHPPKKTTKHKKAHKTKPQQQWKMYSVIKMRNSFPEDVVVVKGIKWLERKVINIHNSPPVATIHSLQFRTWGNKEGLIRQHFPPLQAPTLMMFLTYHERHYTALE